jgi:hypothetical protein
MIPELRAVARRAVACKGWRWVSGMQFEAEWLPDLRSPATMGCLLALVREAWGEPLGSVYYLVTMVEEPGWFAEFGDSEELYDTEAEALVAALEAASL